MSLATRPLLRKEVNARGIKVSLIEPGAVGSDMQPTTSKQERLRGFRYG